MEISALARELFALRVEAGVVADAQPVSEMERLAWSPGEIGYDERELVCGDGGGGISGKVPIRALMGGIVGVGSDMRRPYFLLCATTITIDNSAVSHACTVQSKFVPLIGVIWGNVLVDSRHPITPITTPKADHPDQLSPARLRLGIFSSFNGSYSLQLGRIEGVVGQLSNEVRSWE